MNANVQQYIDAADRENTTRSYASALRHFEVEWKGLLPATIDTVARYLEEHATVYKISTLRLHLAALARWHADNGFADPTRSPLVLKVLRGIRANTLLRSVEHGLFNSTSWRRHANGCCKRKSQRSRVVAVLKRCAARAIDPCCCSGSGERSGRTSLRGCASRKSKPCAVKG